MKNIRYRIEFFSRWHCGSGLSAGADVDALVVKDKNGMPFIPGKTLKGLFREATEDYLTLSGEAEKLETSVRSTLGTLDDKGGFSKGTAFFSNATLCSTEYDEIVRCNAQEFLFQSVSSTANGKDGVGDEHSLRRIQVVVPCTLEAEIQNIPDDMTDVAGKALQMIKHMGLDRNRGLGRCQLTIIAITETKEGGMS